MADHPLATIMKLDPMFMDHLKKTDDLVFSHGALPTKIKLLIALAFDAAHGASSGVRSLAQSALKEGATKAEIAETIRVAYHLAGVGSVYAASQGLAEALAGGT